MGNYAHGKGMKSGSANGKKLGIWLNLFSEVQRENHVDDHWDSHTGIKEEVSSPCYIQ
jgi:hypothetical protein